ncbi:Uncharacterised protein [uncultured archaeon]|nr:Uncharacterised protein [uncultured archaeon]
MTNLVILETNVDDATPEELAHALETLLKAGALDAHIIPCVMKKGRPGFLFRVLTKDPKKHVPLVMEHTGTLGVRIIPLLDRVEAPRSTSKIQVVVAGKKHGVRIKKSPVKNKAEFDDIARIADEHKMSVRKVKKSLR